MADVPERKRLMQRENTVKYKKHAVGDASPLRHIQESFVCNGLI